MKKQIKYRPKGLKKAEDDYIKAMMRREIILTILILVIGALVIMAIIAMAEEALVR